MEKFTLTVGHDANGNGYVRAMDGHWLGLGKLENAPETELAVIAEVQANGGKIDPPSNIQLECAYVFVNTMRLRRERMDCEHLARVAAQRADREKRVAKNQKHRRVHAEKRASE